MFAKNDFKDIKIANIPNGWDMVIIKNVAAINELSLENNSENTLISYIDIASVDNRIINHIQEINLFDAPSRAKRILREYDILISSVRPNLKHYTIIKNQVTNWVASTGFVVITSKDVYPYYLYYYLTTDNYTEYLTQIAEGHTSAYPSFNPDIIENTKIPLPPLPEQKAIASILSSFDDKIELNNRMNKTLEQMARAIFKSLFVDFDPMLAKLEGRDVGLLKEVGDLFPDSFEDSELGEIPKGWKISTIREVATKIQYGLTQSASSEPIGPRFLRITDIQGGKVNWNSVPYCHVSPEEYQKYQLKPGDILVARTGASTGENIYLPVVPDSVFASYLVRFQFAESAMARFVGSFMRTSTYYEYVKGSIGGSAQPNANAQTLANVKIILPRFEIVEYYANLVASFDARIYSNNMESNTISSLRDSLLPKLMSGELRVPPEKVQE